MSMHAPVYVFSHICFLVHMILQKTAHQYMKKQEHAQQIPYMLAGAIDTYIDSGFGQHNSTQQNVWMLTYTPCPPVPVVSKH